MKNMIKRISVFALVAAIACGAGLLAACGEGGQAEEKTYTVTVVDPEGKGMEGVNVSWGKTSGKTDKDGKASAALPAGDYDVNLSGLPKPYLADPAKATAEQPDVKITLKIDYPAPGDGKLLYTVRVLYPDGAPLAGAMVMMCTPILPDGSGGICTPFPDPTNIRGESYFGLAAGEYEVQIITGIPSGYTYDVDENLHYTGETASAEKTTVTITLKQA